MQNKCLELKILILLDNTSKFWDSLYTKHKSDENVVYLFLQHILIYFTIKPTHLFAHLVIILHLSSNPPKQKKHPIKSAPQSPTTLRGKISLTHHLILFNSSSVFSQR